MVMNGVFIVFVCAHMKGCGVLITTVPSLIVKLAASICRTGRQAQKAAQKKAF